ncbi:hypothetical protein JHN48_29270, partial [Streptomyces sp. MBT72]|nr:hypothetical protein [Streptomyces sp. MBT72]
MKKVFLSSQHRCLALALALAGVPLFAAPAPAAPTPTTKVFATPGTFDFTVPQGVNSIEMTAVGSGGGGGAANSG